MANMRSVSIKGAIFFVFCEEKEDGRKSLTLGVNLADAPAEQIWISNEKFEVDSKNETKLVHKKVGQIHKKRHINLMDDFDVFSGKLEKVETIGVIL